ncbi:hypothetical protein DFH08DRAFT_1088566 [Mycena albidolilacea]|uniref:Transmembrane protein n=1 Tax=Mycena albidolilacea TaxID=1033008 RepID=A0AAD6Z5B4_9AGAR|nr:hypothetical protein DFH08DRAFT_1088566 [Mycena albidolilacea]
MVNTVIVDERDSSILYSNGWNDNGQFLEFDGTTRWSSNQGSTATFTFGGSSVKIYGSVAANPGQASLGFVIDQSLTGSYSAKQGGTGLYHELLWESPTLSEGSHTLVITQTAAQSNGVIYLDYIMYETESAVGTYFVDDRDPRIAYTPAWRQFVSENDFQHTSSESTNPGDSFSFQFEGSAIQLYGGLNTFDADSAVTSITLDGGAPFTYTAPNPIPATTNNRLYHAEGLSADTHTLVVTSTSTHTAWMDYFLVTPHPASSSGGTTSPPPPSSPGTTTGTTVTTDRSGATVTVTNTPVSRPPGSSSKFSGSGASVVSHTSGGSIASALATGSNATSAAAPIIPSGSSSDTNSPPVSAQSKSKSKTPTGAIAGGVLGALLFLALLAACFFLRRRRHARREVESDKEDPLAARPFATPPPPASLSKEPTDSCSSPYSPSETPSSAVLLEPLRGNRNSNSKLAREVEAARAFAPANLDPEPDSRAEGRMSGAGFSFLEGAGGSSIAGSEAPPQYSARSVAEVAV